VARALGFKRTAIVAAAAAAALAGGGTVYAFAAEGGAYLDIDTIECVSDTRAVVSISTLGERGDGRHIFWRTAGAGAEPRSGEVAWSDSRGQSFRVSIRPGVNLKVSIEEADGRSLAFRERSNLCNG
jgi:hypothetical protein